MTFGLRGTSNGSKGATKPPANPSEQKVGQQVIESCTILTTEANDVLRPVHDRMLVILHPDDYELWLDDDVRKRELIKDLLRPYPAEEMTSYPVSIAINSPRNQGETLIERIAVNSA